MVRFLTQRPIAVTMTFIAFMLLGLAATTRLPVSLMPDIDIPEITVHIEASNYSARQLENGVVQPIRRQLLQVPHIEDIHSETRNEQSVIRLRFAYGTQVDMAFIDVNEKIDRAMNALPQDVKRPRVVKASASDVPVFFLQITATQNKGQEPLQANFVDLSRFADQVIKKRLEQLPEVAMADISGTLENEIVITPDEEKLASLGLDLNAIESAIKSQQYNLGDIVVRDGQYQYSLKFRRELANINNLRSVLIKTGNKQIRLDELATLEVRPQKRNGLVTQHGAPALSLAVIKNSGARMQELKASLNQLVQYFRDDYPQINFQIIRDQTQLLDYALGNLGQTLWMGGILAFLIMLVFLREWRSPLLIAISIPASLIISVLFFYLIGLSINIISLSGLVLGIGMMIDNSIIVIDNITQHMERQKSLLQACVEGTNEIIRPLISSVLTTCAVFLPLIFISGMAGALFYDQAIAVTVGLFSSLIVSITLVPVYYRIVFKKLRKDREKIKPKPLVNYMRAYEQGLFFTFRKQPRMFALVVLLMLTGAYAYTLLTKSQLPPVEHTDFFISVDWREKIHVEENSRRADALLSSFDSLLTTYAVYAGNQQYLMQQQRLHSVQEAEIYIDAINADVLAELQTRMRAWLKQNYPRAEITLRPPESVFQRLFQQQQAVLEARLIPMERGQGLDLAILKNTLQQIDLPETRNSTAQLPVESYFEVHLHQAKLLLYQVSRINVMQALQSLFNQYQVTQLKSSHEFVPIILGGQQTGFFNRLNRAVVTSEKGHTIPLRELVTLNRAQGLKTLHAGKAGPYYPLPLEVHKGSVPQVQKRIENALDNEGMDVQWAGSYFANRQMIREITLILLISLLLLFFILAAQFESLALPFIVLLEVPIDIGGALLFLKLFDQGINVMSLIGIIVMTGIIINDSILKIDTINRLHMQGTPLLKAIIVGGQRRLKPILMTSLTTIMAMVPFLFVSGMGSDLQKPLAVAVIGGMFVGTLVSLYVVPLLFYYLKRTHNYVGN
ncbi:MAG: efflux RND transporter permease subunit [Bacteroidales bacterium]